MQQTVSFPSGDVIYYHDSIDHMWPLYDDRHIIVLTDEHVAAAHPQLFAGRQTIILQPGEHSKTLTTLAYVTDELIRLEATRSTLLIGVGGGVITDITGFAAATYMRGITAGFVPTTVLGMTDAAIGGKNGVNIGLYKNITGTIRQPAFIYNDVALLATLPRHEWSNGFAEIIKYACLFDRPLFDELYHHDLAYYMTNKDAMNDVIARCVAWKNKIVAIDEHEKKERKLLNFGHTAAHAIENLYDLPHGQAVALGMVIAARLSEDVAGLNTNVSVQLKQLLSQYELPTTYDISVDKAMELLKMDKKRQRDTIDYILLEDIGVPKIQPLATDIIAKAFDACKP